MRQYILSLLLIFSLVGGVFIFSAVSKEKGLRYPIVDTNQSLCYNSRMKISCPEKTTAFYGQDAQYNGIQPDYTDNGNGTITDKNTGLMWQKDPGKKMTYRQALARVKGFKLAGYGDWRLPTIKELYSLILFSGMDVDPRSSRAPKNLQPFINNKYFKFKYGSREDGERIIDSQYLSATKYVSFTMGRDETVFGVNFADGRIKGYPIRDPRRRSGKKFAVLYVRGNPQYGKNNFKDNKDGTITDNATGLTWMKVDSGHLRAGSKKNGKLDWLEALQWAENLTYAKHSDWRLPNAKELQSIVDYSRSPDTTKSAAIDPVFQVSSIKDERGKKNYSNYWTGTTHARLHGGETAVYVAFGSSLGWMRPPWGGKRNLLDVHGAGSQRSDPKVGNPEEYPYGRGPQGDVIRIYNHVRCVRGG
ncbi:MAG: DUF1566 domain-containing protein [bacterium]|nr:DUF1566 domain-containing protein [bacterium]